MRHKVSDFPHPIYLAGATAVGKSALALELAERLGGEIISVDSMQVYCGLDIGTDKPSREVRQRVAHHLIDICELEEAFDAGQFVRLAQKAQKEIRSRGRVPIFCGGTGMYFKALIEGLAEVPTGSPELRAQFEAVSLEELVSRLQAIAPEYVNKIDCKNRRRVERALEIATLSGKEALKQRVQWAEEAVSAQKDYLFYILRRPREELVNRIHERIDRMFERGLVDETRHLLEHGLEQNKTAMQAIGYRQIVAYLGGKCSLAEATEEIKARTRQFSKRQGTWFRGQLPYAHQLDCSPTLADQIIREYLQFHKVG